MSKIRFTEYKVKLKLTTDILGTIPKNEKLYTDFIKTKAPEDVTENPDIKVEEEKGWTGFHSDDKGLYVFNYFIMGFLKNAGNTLKEQLDRKAYKSLITRLVFVMERKTRFIRNGVPLMKADDCNERSIRTTGPQGPRVALIKSDVINPGVTLEFTIKVVDGSGKKYIDEDDLRTLFDYGELMGLGQFRNGGYGRFTYTLNRV